MTQTYLYLPTSCSLSIYFQYQQFYIRLNPWEWESVPFEESETFLSLARQEVQQHRLQQAEAEGGYQVRSQAEEDKKSLLSTHTSSTTAKVVPVSIDDVIRSAGDRFCRAGLHDYIISSYRYSFKTKTRGQGEASQACPQEEAVLNTSSEADHPSTSSRASGGLRGEEGQLQLQRRQQQEQEEDEEIQAGVPVQLLQLQHLHQGLPRLPRHVEDHQFRILKHLYRANTVNLFLIL